MKLTENYIYLIKKLSILLSDVTNNWAFIGSMNHYIQGVNTVPNDVDIISTKIGSYNIEKILKEFTVQSVSYQEKESIRSYYGEFNIFSKSIEVFSEVENRINGKWEIHPPWENQIKKYIYKNIEIPVLPLKYELLVYRNLGLKSKENQLSNAIKNIP